MMPLRWVFCLVAVALVALSGCTGHDEARDLEATDRAVVDQPPRAARLHFAKETTSVEEAAAVIGPQAAAALSVASALCNWADRCEEIGERRAHESREQCFRDTGKEWMGRLSGPPCERGIDFQLFEACLDSIRNDECRSPLDTLARLAACQPSVFCPGT